MNWLDVAIIISAVLAGYNGYKTGLVRSALLIAGIIVGVVLAGQVGGRVGQELGDLGAPGGSRLLGFAVILALCIVAAFLLGLLARKFIKTLLIGWLDDVAGVLAGLAICALVWTSLIVAAGSTELQWATKAVQESELGSRLADNGGAVLSLLPDEYRDVLAWVSDVEIPEVGVAGATVTDASPSSARLEGLIMVSNPNRFGGALYVRYEVFWQDGATWRLAGFGERTNVAIGAHREKEVSLSLEARRDDGAESAALLDALIAGRLPPLRLQGVVSARFPSETVEVSFQDAVPLQREQ